MRRNPSSLSEGARFRCDGPGASHIMMQGHFLWNPKSNAAADQPEPNHEVILLRAVKTCHGVAQEAWVDEKRRYSSDGMVLRGHISNRGRANILLVTTRTYH
jgi:hypothetical protein